MQITNKFNLPATFLKATTFSGHRKADYSISELIQPTKITILKKKYDSFLTEDCSERIWALLGSATHYVLEKGDTTGFAEKYLLINIDGVKVSGMVDAYDPVTKVISDFKITSVWSLMLGNHLDWEKQLNCYAYLYIKNGYEVSGLQNCLILRDYSKFEALRNPDYPKGQVIVLPQKLWDIEETESWIKGRIKSLQLATSDDNALPDCTPEEKWQDKDKWALMRNGAKRAIKLYDNKGDALAAASKELDLYVQDRPGVPKKCLEFCSIRDYCAQYKAYNSKKS